MKYVRVKLTELQGEIEESLDIDVFNSPLEIWETSDINKPVKILNMMSNIIDIETAANNN